MPRVRELCRVLLDDHPQLDKWFDRNADAFCTGDRPIWLVRHDDSEVMGLLIGKCVGVSDAKCSLIYVKPQFRGSGLEKLLLQTFEEHVKDIHPFGPPPVHLSVYVDQEQSVKFFLRQGYGIAAQFFHPTENKQRSRFLMEKQL